MLKLVLFHCFQFCWLTIVIKMIFQSIQNNLSIQARSFFIMLQKLQILIHHHDIEKYFLTNLQYGISTICADNWIYIWFSNGCYCEPHSCEEPHGSKLCYTGPVRGIFPHYSHTALVRVPHALIPWTGPCLLLQTFNRGPFGVWLGQQQG